MLVMLNHWLREAWEKCSFGNNVEMHPEGYKLGMSILLPVRGSLEEDL